MAPDRVKALSIADNRTAGFEAELCKSAGDRPGYQSSDYPESLASNSILHTQSVWTIEKLERIEKALGILPK
jgi:hypothetical protein